MKCDSETAEILTPLHATAIDLTAFQREGIRASPTIPDRTPSKASFTTGAKR